MSYFVAHSRNLYRWWDNETAHEEFINRSELAARAAKSTGVLHMHPPHAFGCDCKNDKINEVLKEMRDGSHGRAR